MVMGRPITTKEALDWKVIHQVYTDDVHLKKMLMVYGMEYSKRGANRELIRTLKSKMHAETLRVVRKHFTYVSNVLNGRGYAYSLVLEHIYPFSVNI